MIVHNNYVLNILALASDPPHEKVGIELVRLCCSCCTATIMLRTCYEIYDIDYRSYLQLCIVRLLIRFVALAYIYFPRIRLSQLSCLGGLMGKSANLELWVSFPSKVAQCFFYYSLFRFGFVHLPCILSFSCIVVMRYIIIVKF